MKTNIALFYIYRIVSRLYFYLPVLFVYFYLNNIQIVYIETLLAAYGIMIMITTQININVKMLNYLKHKTVISIGELLKALGLVIIAFNHEFQFLLLAEIISGVGYSITAGTDASLLRSMFINSDLEYYKKVESGSNSYMFLSFLLAGILGSILFNINHKFVFFVSIGTAILSALTILFIQEEKVVSPDPNNHQETTKTSLTHDQCFWKYYYAMSRAFALAPFVGFLPYLFFVELHINLNLFGLVLSLFTLSGFFSSRYILKLSTKINIKKLAFLSMAIGALSLALFALSKYIFINLIAIILLGGVSGAIRPLATTNLNLINLSAKQRTYIFSSMEKVYGLWNAILLIIGGIFMERIKFQWFVFGLSIFYIFSLLVLYVNFMRQSPELLQPKKETNI